MTEWNGERRCRRSVIAVSKSATLWYCGRQARWRESVHLVMAKKGRRQEPSWFRHLPEPKARTAGSIVPYFLWDKPSYLLGVETGETKTQKKFASSRALHLELLKDAQA